jgi:hypothetical protein
MLNSYYSSLKNAPPNPHLRDKKETHGPESLADAVIHELRAIDSIVRMPISYFSKTDDHWLSENGLRELIQIAYYASQSPEEGRYPRASFFWGAYKHEWLDTCEFSNEDVVTVEKVRKLAPICHNQTTAIRVKLLNKKLVIAGLTALKFEGLDVFPGRPGFLPINREFNIQIHILGPGHIRVDATDEYELRAGSLRQCTRLSQLPPITLLTSEFSAAVSQNIIKKRAISNEDKNLFGGLEYCFDNCHLLELILRPIIQSGHGGSVLIVPRNQLDHLTQNALIVANAASNLNLSTLATEHLGRCIDFCLSADTSDTGMRFSQWIQTRGRLASAANAIGDMSSIDGCVVLTRDFSMVGFGVKINVSREDAQNSKIQYRNASTNSLVELNELEKFGGMRFQSAMRFCKKYPNVLAFVISQDRDMKVLWSDEENAFAFGPVTISSIPKFG